jgi:HPt (histidine-containing phosphotransfer) domain-containing protein
MSLATNTSTDLQPADAPCLEEAAWTVEALRSVWERQRGRINDRVAVIERAVTALADDRLDTDLRTDAQRAAHMLAGSLGMFGFVGASDAAHELEAELAHPSADRPPVLSALVRRLRGEIQGEVALCSPSATAQPHPVSSPD